MCEASGKRSWNHGGKKTTERGYGWDWQQCRDAFIKEHPVCADPFGRHVGRVVPADHVDHVVPLSKGGNRLDFANLQALCAGCHNHKTASERAV